MLLFSTQAWADVSTPTEFTEADGSPSVFDPWKVSVSNTTLTDNLDGSISITTGGSGSGITAFGNRGLITFMSSDSTNISSDGTLQWYPSSNTLVISRDAGQSGYAFIISGDTGTLLANINHDGSAFFDSLTLNTDLAVTQGGTGVSTLTDGAVLLGNGAGVITDTGVLAKGVLIVGDGTTDPTLLTVGANGTVLSADSAQTSGVKWEAITKPSRHYYWPASALLPLEAAADSISPISKDSGTNLDNLNRAFDATTDECVTGTMEVPADVKMDGTVTIRAKAYAVAPATTFVLWKFNHVPVGSNESWDSALSTVSFDGVAFSSTQDQLTVASDTATISTLGWVSSDTVFFTFCRDADTAGDTLVGDALLIDLSVDIPRG